MAEAAPGGFVDDLPPGSYWSMNFIGTVAGICGGSIATYLGQYTHVAHPAIPVDAFLSLGLADKYDIHH